MNSHPSPIVNFPDGDCCHWVDTTMLGYLDSIRTRQGVLGQFIRVSQLNIFRPVLVVGQMAGHIFSSQLSLKL